jgi:hypothetical protein
MGLEEVTGFLQNLDLLVIDEQPHANGNQQKNGVSTSTRVEGASRHGQGTAIDSRTRLEDSGRMTKYLSQKRA